jgi:hypothetical protein
MKRREIVAHHHQIDTLSANGKTLFENAAGTTSSTPTGTR